MAIVGLYRDIYGIQPKPNRFYLEPHSTPELNGTKLRYELRGRLYLVDLNTGNYAISTGTCTLHDSHPFGINATGSGFEYFPSTNSDWAMAVSRSDDQPLTIRIENWPSAPDAPRQWTETAPQAKGAMLHRVAHLRPNAIYDLKANGQIIDSLQADKAGCIRFECKRDYAVPQNFELSLTGY